MLLSEIMVLQLSVSVFTEVYYFDSFYRAPIQFAATWVRVNTIPSLNSLPYRVATIRANIALQFIPEPMEEVFGSPKSVFHG
jgi:hypothetical protein